MNNKFKFCISIFLLPILYSTSILSAEEDDFGSTGIVVDNVRGLIKPVERAVMSSEITAKIKAIPFKSGNVLRRANSWLCLIVLFIVPIWPLPKPLISQDYTCLKIIKSF